MGSDPSINRRGSEMNDECSTGIDESNGTELTVPAPIIEAAFAGLAGGVAMGILLSACPIQLRVLLSVLVGMGISVISFFFMIWLMKGGARPDQHGF